MKSSSKTSLLAVALAASALFTSVAMAGIAESAEETKPLKAGAAIPDVTLNTAAGKPFSLLEEGRKQPAVYIFYRGGWCPYCNRHLAAMQDAEAELKELGFRILAISPDSGAALDATTEKNKLGYTLLSDAEMKATDAFGLAFKIEGRSADRLGRDWMPVPALYISDKHGKLAFAHTDADYKKRLDVDEVLAAARKIAGK